MHNENDKIMRYYIYINISNNIISIKIILNFAHSIIYIYYSNHKYFNFVYLFNYTTNCNFKNITENNYSVKEN